MAFALATCRVYSPSAESLAHRAHIASTLASLRTPTIKVPFWQLAAHRIPTLWTLYRGLLVNAPAEIVSLHRHRLKSEAECMMQVRTRIRWEFTRLRHLTSPATTRDHLLRLYRVSLFVSFMQLIILTVCAGNSGWMSSDRRN